MSLGRWVTLIVLLGAAFGAGHVVGSSGGERATPELTTASGPEPSSVEAPGAMLHGSQGPTLAAPDTHDADAAPFARALAELPPLEVPRGDGRIDVTVKTEDGTGVPGVRVTCVPEMPQGMAQPRREGWQDDVDAARILLQAANNLRWRREARLDAVTDDAGSCSFEGLINVQHAVTAQADGWHLRSTFRNVHKAEPGATIEFTAKPRTRIRVEVVMPDGTAPDRAQVRFHRGNGVSGRSWTPDRPEVDAEPGTWDVSATAGDGERLLSPTEQVTVELGSPPPVLRLQLAERTSLETTVVSAPGEGAVPVVLRQIRVPTGVAPDTALLGSSNDRLHLSPSTGGSMSNTRFDLEPGTWLVGVYRGQQGPLILSRTVDVKPGRNELALQLPPTPREDYALLSVRGPDGEPLQGLSFMSSLEAEDGSSSGGGASVLRRPDGEYWVFHQAASLGKRGGTCRISVEHPKLGKKLLSFPAGETRTFDVRFEEPATLVVAVEGSGNDRYAGRLSVQVSADVESNVHMLTSGSNPTPVAADGHAVVASLQPGDYRVAVQLGRAPWGGTTLAEEVVKVRTGEQTIRLRVPTLYVVEFEGISSQAHLQRTDVDMHHAFISVVQPADEGRAILDGLVAGEYRLQMGTKVTTFRLPGTSKVRIE